MASTEKQVVNEKVEHDRAAELKAFEYDMTSMRLVAGNGWSELGTFYFAAFIHIMAILFDLVAFTGSGLLISGLWASNIGTRSVVEIELLIYSLFQLFVHFRSTFFAFDVSLIPFKPILTRAQAYKRDGFEWYEQNKVLFRPRRNCIKQPKVILFHFFMQLLFGVLVTAIVFGIRNEPISVCISQCCVKWQSNGTFIAIGDSPCLTSSFCAASACCASGYVTKSNMQLCLNPTNTLLD